MLICDNRYYEKVGSEVKDITDELPFEIPDSWVWTRLESSVLINPRNDLSDNIDVSFVEMKSISDGYNNHFSATTRLWKEVKSGFTHFQDGDVGFAKITPCFQNRKSVVFSGLQNGYGAGTTELHILRAVKSTITTEYLLLFVKSSYFIERGIQKFSGTAGQQRFGTDEVKKTPFPLPPLEEQARIVNRIDELFEQIDIIEQNQADIDTLYDEFRKRTLTLAIQGKLVPQDSNDEPASVLLERIRAEKKAKLGKKFVDSYIYKGDDNCYYEKVKDSVKEISAEIPFDVPESWQWIRIDNLFQHNTGKALNSSNTKGILHPYITTSNVYWGHFCLDCVKEMPFTEDEFSKCSIVPGDLLVCEGGDVGRAAIWEKDIPMCIQNHIHRLRAYYPVCTQFYYFAFFVYKSIGLIGGKGIGIQGLSSGALGKLIFPLPPLAEQERIVKQVGIILEKLKDED